MWLCDSKGKKYLQNNSGLWLVWLLWFCNSKEKKSYILNNSGLWLVWLCDSIRHIVIYKISLACDWCVCVIQMEKNYLQNSSCLWLVWLMWLCDSKEREKIIYKIIHACDWCNWCDCDSNEKKLCTK